MSELLPTFVARHRRCVGVTAATLVVSMVIVAGTTGTAWAQDPPPTGPPSSVVEPTVPTEPTTVVVVPSTEVPTTVAADPPVTEPVVTDAPVTDAPADTTVPPTSAGTTRAGGGGGRRTTPRSTTRTTVPIDEPATTEAPAPAPAETDATPPPTASPIGEELPRATSTTTTSLVPVARRAAVVPTEDGPAPLIVGGIGMAVVLVGGLAWSSRRRRVDDLFALDVAPVPPSPEAAAALAQWGPDVPLDGDTTPAARTISSPVSS